MGLPTQLAPNVQMDFFYLEILVAKIVLMDILNKDLIRPASLVFLLVNIALILVISVCLAYQIIFRISSVW
jgi:hypothetical protein